jgi:hypothetical protein
LDLVFSMDGRRFGAAFQYNDAPAITRSMRVALKDLALEYVFVIYTGEQLETAEERVIFLPLSEIQRLHEELNTIHE